jgi:oligosaccharide repeat unit polymerase
MLLLMFLLLATPIVMTTHIARMLRPNHVRVVDLGVVFIWIIFLYAFLPILGIWLASLDIGALADSRLGKKVPNPSLVLGVGSSFAAFMMGFAWVYSRKRAPHSRREFVWQVPTSPDVLSTVALVVIVKLGLLLLRFFFAADVPNDYVSSYTVYRAQPILIQQLAAVIATADLAATMLLIVVAVAYTRRFYLLISALLALQLVIAFVGGGSRTSAFLCAFAFIVSLSIYDRRLRPWLIWTLAAGGVIAFAIAGQIRDGFDASKGPISLQLLQGGEFLNVFDDALDLMSRPRDNVFQSLRVQMYLVDVLRLIPQQIIGNLKVDPGALYVSAFYPTYSDAGGGWAFGAIAESTIGFGWPEALIRGALLGWLYAAVANHFLRSHLKVIGVFVYVWFVVVSYQSVRNTTFSTIAFFVMRVLPLLIVLRLSGTLRNVKRVRGIVHPTTRPQRL